MYPFCSCRGYGGTLLHKMVAEIGPSTPGTSNGITPHGNASYSTGDLYIKADRTLSRGDDNTKFVYLAGTYASADYTAFWTIKPHSAITYWEGTTRGNTTGNEQWYGLLYRASTGGWTLLRFNGDGSSSTIATWTSALTTGQEYQAALDVTGTGATVTLVPTLDGVIMGAGPYTDTTGSRITGAGVVGVGFATDGGNGSDSAGMHWKDMGAVGTNTGIRTNKFVMKIGGGNVTFRLRKSGGSNWVSGTTFSVSGGAAAYVSKSLVDVDTYDVTVSPGSTEAEITITDSTNSYTVKVIVVKDIPSAQTFTNTEILAGTTWNTRIASGVAHMNVTPSEVTYAFTGTSVQVVLNPTNIGGTSANYPYWKAIIDDGDPVAPTSAQIAAAATGETVNVITLASGLAAGTHTIRFLKQKVKYDGSDCWLTSGTRDDLQIDAFLFDGNGATTTAPANSCAVVPTYHALLFGDSICSGVKVDGTTVPSHNDGDAALGQALGWGLPERTRVHTFAFPGQGWDRPGFNTVPNFFDSSSGTASQQTFGFYDNTNAWAFPANPNYVFVMQGTNDSISSSPTADGTVTSRTTAFIAHARSLWPSAQIIVMSFGGYKASAISSGVTAAADGNTVYLPLYRYSRGCSYYANGDAETAHEYSYDGIHPDRTGQAIVANGIVKEFLTANSSGLGPVRRTGGGLIG